MNLQNQKRLAAKVLKCGKQQVILGIEHLPEIKESITTADIRGLIQKGHITRHPPKDTSRGRARLLHLKKRSGKKHGSGSRKGRATARTPRKETWIKRIRVQRRLLEGLKERNKIKLETYHDLYKKAKGGFFRSERHIKIYIEEHRLII